MSLFENASQESGHQVSDSAERPRRINASVLGHDRPEWLAGLLGRLQTMEASIAALSRAADLRPAVAVTDPPTEVERRRSARQFTRRLSSAGLDPSGEQSSVCFDVTMKCELLAFVKTQVEALDFKRNQRW